MKKKRKELKNEHNLLVWEVIDRIQKTDKLTKDEKLKALRDIGMLMQSPEQAKRAGFRIEDRNNNDGVNPVSFFDSSVKDTNFP